MEKFVRLIFNLYSDISANFLHHRLSEMSSNLDSTPTAVKAYDWLAWFARFQWFSYLGMGFQLLSIDLTTKFWHSIYYIGHLGLPIFYVIGIMIVKPLSKIILPSKSTSTGVIRDIRSSRDKQQ